MSACAKLVTLALLAAGCFTKPDRPPEPGDGAIPITPHVVSDAHGVNANASSTTLMVQIPPGDDQFLLVALHLGASCPDVIPSVIEVRAGTTLMTKVDAIAGSPCGPGSRSEHWSLVQPPTGDPVPVTFVLDSSARSFHTIAIVLDGVDQAQPVRASKPASGMGNDSVNAIDSAVGDLVIDTIGQGEAIDAPGIRQQRVTSMNQSPSTTLDNSAASSMPGDAVVTMTWTFAQADEWQTIVTSIRPATR